MRARSEACHLRSIKRRPVVNARAVTERDQGHNLKSIGRDGVRGDSSFSHEVLAKAVGPLKGSDMHVLPSKGRAAPRAGGPCKRPLVQAMSKLRNARAQT